MLEILFGQIAQAIYFSLFLIFTKELKGKQTILFTVLMIFQYLILKHICRLNYNINFELLYTFFTFIILKICYKEESRITDLITILISYLLLAPIGIIIFLIFKNVELMSIINNLTVIYLVCKFKNNLPTIEQFYKNVWNRHNNPKYIKSITMRVFSSILIPITFILMNLWLIYGIIIMK